jgi:hypothetical protein
MFKSMDQSWTLMASMLKIADLLVSFYHIYFHFWHGNWEHKKLSKNV